MVHNDLVLHPKKYKGEDGYRVFSVRVKENTVQRLEALSTQTNRSRNELINILLDFAIDRCVIADEDDNQKYSMYCLPGNYPGGFFISDGIPVPLEQRAGGYPMASGMRVSYLSDSTDHKHHQ